jgi:hypothetical protein
MTTDDNVTAIGTKAPAKRAAAKRTPAKRTSGSKIPATAKRPTDRPKSAAQLEAEGADLVDITWEGITFQVNGDPDSWDFWTVTQPLAQGNIPAGLIGLLGPDQALKLRVAKPALTNLEARALFDELNKALGLHNTGN